MNERSALHEARPEAAAPASPPPLVIAVLTCFNRRALTLTALGALEAAAKEAQVDLEGILVDDASTDGTAAAVRGHFPWVDVVEGSGALYWNRGMHRGFGMAMQRHADYYLWLNDDTALELDALRNLLAQSRSLLAKEGKPVIMVGATADHDSNRITYGGRVARSRFRRFAFDLVWSDEEPMACQAMEGNCVLIPRDVALRVGNLDPVFEHAMGDTDYGLRAQALGFKVYVGAGIAGHCSRNPATGTYNDPTLPMSTRWRLILGRKGLPVRSWLHFTKRHGGLLWPLYFSWPYAKLLASSMPLRPGPRT